jgi:hypothetical protein
MTGDVDPRSVFVDYRPRPRRRKLLLIGVGVVLLLVGAVYVIRSTVSSPESAVRGYFDALADRDADAALAATAPEVREQVARDVISGAVLRSDGYAPPRDVDVTAVTVDGRGAVAEVSYLVDDRPQSASLRLRRDEGMLDSVLHQWLVVDGIGSLRLLEAPEEVTVNGQPVVAYDAQGPRILPVLPGGYQVGVPADDPLWESRSVPARVAPQEVTDVSVPLAARPVVRDGVEAQVRDLLDDCAASTELVPPGCPFGYAVVAQAEDVAWRIQEYPRLSLTAGREADRTVVLVGTSQEGEAVITGSRRFVGEFEETVPFPVTGVATVQSDSVLFQPDP